VGDDWHEFFKDFPDLDPKNADLPPDELERLSAAAPGWKWVGEASARAEEQLKHKEAEPSDSDIASEPD
jgi:hypothetical protein